VSTVFAESLFELHTPGSDDGYGAGPTLEELVSGAWEGLAAHAAVACPACGGAMHPRVRETGAAGHCGECGAELR
jgi:hypothetical protein